LCCELLLNYVIIKGIKMAVTKEDVLEYISGLSVLELAELVKEFEEKFGVSAQPVAVAGGAAAGGEDASEKT
jgi:large subunit ribosomal protein L7/L12